MRKSTPIPRIIKIHEVSGFKVYCAFNTGEHRVIDCQALFSRWNYAADAFRAQLLNPGVFEQLQLEEGTLVWPNLTKTMELSNGASFTVAFNLDPVVLYEESQPDAERNKRYHIGGILRDARKKAGLTQAELARRSGTAKNYISRIENNQSDIELGTLIKIIEIGLDKQLDLHIS